MKTIKLCLLLNAIFLGAQTGNFKNENSRFRNESVAHAYLGDGKTENLFSSLANKGQKDIFLKDRYASYYFNNLNTNFGNNTHGSCGFVAMGMLLSYYDTYWDNSIISSNYDVKSNYVGNRQAGADFCLVPYDAESPGVKFEPSEYVSDLLYEDYLDYADANKDEYFQFKLFDCAKKKGFDLLNRSRHLGLDGDYIYDVLDWYLYHEKNFTRNDININFFEADNDEQEEHIINNIIEGRPTLIVLMNGLYDWHCVVAYDYDENTGDIFVHTGWRNTNTNQTLTHVSLEDLEYRCIATSIDFEVNTNKNLGTKYVSQYGDSMISESFVFPRNIKVDTTKYFDVSPVYSWDSLYTERWIQQYNPYFRFSILDSSDRTILERTVRGSTSYALSDNEWKEVYTKTLGNYYSVYVTLDSDVYPYFDDIWCKNSFKRPVAFKDRVNICPNEYGYGDFYPTDSNTRSTFVKHNVRNIQFETRRYRAGYIHNECLVLSPIRSGINEAFIEYRFKTALDSIDVELSHWRSQSQEGLRNTNGIAVVQQFIGTNWVTVFDMLNPSNNLPTDRNNKRMYSITFSQPAYRVRFYAKYNGTSTSSSNKGRICIGNLYLNNSSYTLPLSGSELNYEPTLWNNNSNVLYGSNCYSYAVNAPKNPTFNYFETMQPGQSVGKSCTKDDIINVSPVLSLISEDAAKLGFGFTRIDAEAVCNPGFYKVAFVLDPNEPGFDYHWYRQNSDGSWSHKPGTTPVKDTDNDGRLIMDPEECNRNGGYLNYSVFVGYFAVKPLNTSFN